MRLMRVSAIILPLFLALAAVVVAQERPEGQRGERGRGGPPGGGFMFGGFRASRMMLLRVPEVQKELELVDEQLAEIRKIEEELRAKYPMGGGRGGPGGERREGDRGPRTNGASIVPASWYFVQAQDNTQPGQGRRGFGGQPPTEEDRARFEQQRAERAREERTRLADVLLPEQMQRLTQIYLQLAGVGALQDEDVAKELGISEAQKAKLVEVQRQNQESFGAAMREMFRGGGGEGDRDANRAKMEELRKANDAKVLAVLSSDQQKKFEAMKGKPFAMPENAFRGPGGGPGGPGGGPGGTRTRRGDN